MAALSICRDNFDECGNDFSRHIGVCVCDHAKRVASLQIAASAHEVTIRALFDAANVFAQIYLDDANAFAAVRFAPAAVH